MTHTTGMRKKRVGWITLVIFLVLAAIIVGLCLLFLQNYVIFTDEGIRLDFSQPTVTRPLDVVLGGKPSSEIFSPTVSPRVLIEDAVLPPS